MSVFHVKKTTDYTVMANYHLRDKSLSLKAKGLLSQMLSLPEEWDYTLQGLAYISPRVGAGGVYCADEGTGQPGTAAGSGVHHLRTAANTVIFTGVGITCVGKSNVEKAYVGKSDAIK